MARPIAYNASGPLSGSIRGGSVNYTIDGAGRDYTTFAGKKWVPSADGAAPIVFVTDSFTRGLTTAGNAYPLFFSCAGTSSAAILYTANRLPGSPGNFTDTGSAFYDLTFSYGYFILEGNDPYQGDYQNYNLLTLDASKITSYPQFSTKFFDLSGNGFTFDLVNGPIWDDKGWFEMDGTDDSIYLSSNTQLQASKTMVMWMRTTDTVALFLSGEPPGTTGGYYVGAWDNSSGFYQNNCGSPTYYIDCEQVSDPLNPVAYNDGRFHMWEAKDLDFKNWTDKWNFGGYLAGYQIGGGIAKIEMYSSSLSPEQSKQNYFGAPIVTDGLVFAIDANNIISYPKSGTSVYNLTSSYDTGTLTNGPIFQPSQGGYWVFDGTDDYLAFGDVADLGTGDFTLSVWVWIPSGTASTFRAILNKKGPSGANAGYGIYYNTGMQKFLWSTANGSSASEIFTSNTFANIENTWANVVMVRQNGATNNGSYYINGIYQSLASAATVLNVDSSYNLSLATAAGPYTPYCFQGNIANAKIYDRALTAAEIQQNYQAEQYKFETPAGPVTNGLVLYWDAGNLDSYPGTGTTIYDLSGNGNNGTLVNGVGYNQTNGGILTFDGVDDYVESGNPQLASTNNTVMGAARYSGGTRGRMINAKDNNWLIGCWNNSTENYYAEGWVSPVQNGPNDTNWRIVTALGNISTDSYASYINNVVNATSNAGSQGPAGITIGKIGYTNSEYSTGEFGFVLVYNRVLTAAEMTQNYNYFKGRFGL